MVFPEISEEVYNEATGQFEPVKEEKEKDHVAIVSATAGKKLLYIKRTEARKLLKCLTQSRIPVKMLSKGDGKITDIQFEIPESKTEEITYLTKTQAEKLAACLKPLDLVSTQIKKLEEVV